jgi:hypothetical protein
MLMWPQEVHLKPDEEYMALLWPEWLADDVLVLPIVSGRVSSPTGEVLNGMPVEKALETLGKWSHERGR